MNQKLKNDILQKIYLFRNIDFHDILHYIKQ